MARKKHTHNLTEAAAMPLLIGSVAVAAAEIGRRLYRHHQMFLPSDQPTKTWNPADYGIPEGAVEEHYFETPDGEELYGWYCRAEKPVASGVFCHGNTGNLTISADVIPHLLNAGFNVLFFDYRGFGKSTGVPTISGVISDGVTAARFHDRIRPKDLPSILYGFSLGGAIAAQVIRRHPFDALILQSTFTSLPKLARVLFPRLPMHLFAGNVFDTLGVIRKLDVPLLVLHGTDDEAIPVWMAREIFEACGHPFRRLVCIDGGLHKDLFHRDPDSLIWAIAQFISDLPHTHRTWSVQEQTPAEAWGDLALRAVRRLLRRRTTQHA